MFRVIGDVHGGDNLSAYLQLASEADYSLQIGDLNIYDYEFLSALNPENHKVLAGNHDNYFIEDGEYSKQTPHFLGDFGNYSIPNFGEFFFIRGGYSIDKDRRINGVSWFENEELTTREMNDAFDLYVNTKPKVVFSHECPKSIIPFVASMKTWGGTVIEPSSTAKFLQVLLDEHQPELWIFGHHHVNWEAEYKSITKFICLAELSYIDL